MLVSLLSLPILASLVAGHAHMTYPLPWQGNGFLKANNCNAGTATAATASWTPGQQVNVTWVIQASDGSGPVTLKLDPTGGVTFPTTITVTSGPTNPTQVNTPFQFVFTVPSVTCTGTNGCSIQAKSSSGWVSCATVKIGAAAAASTTATATPTPSSSKAAAAISASPSKAASVSPSPSKAAAGASPTPSPSKKASTTVTPTPSSDPEAEESPEASPEASPASGSDDTTTSPNPSPSSTVSTGDTESCLTASGLTLCKAINGKSVSLNTQIFPNADGYSTAEFEQLFVLPVYNQEWNNTLVFTNAGTDDCRDKYVRFLCSRNFLSCGETAPTMSSCQMLNQACAPTAEHAFLYNCTDPTVASGSSQLDSYPQSTLTTTSDAAERLGVGMSVAALVAAVFFAL